MSLEEGQLLEVKARFAGIQNTGYPGAFPPRVSKLIASIAESPSLHLFSGVSKIGDVRIDLERPEATLNLNVLDFIKADRRDWKFVIADPPYLIARKDKKLAAYGIKNPISNSVPDRRSIELFLQEHAENVLWFDFASPCPFGFYREKTWVWLHGGWRPCRVLTWLKRKGERL